MDWQIALLLGQDGITNGVIYALLALALVLVFTVTRVIFIPQGEFVTYGTLTLASFQAGRFPGTVWLLVGAGACVALLDGWTAAQQRDWRGLARCLGWNVGLPCSLAALLHLVEPASLPLLVQCVLALVIVVPLGPMVYRLAFQPMAEAPVLVLLIAAVAVHLAMVGFGLYFFGAEGSRTPAFAEWNLTIGDFSLSGQTAWMLAASIVLGGGLYAFFEHSLHGKALRATAINRRGAHLMGISSATAGKWAFTLAAALGAFSGMLIGPITTIYYDTGFLIGLKGFVGAIIGGLASYPLAALGAVLVGLLEAYSSFWASAFKEVIVFSLIIPVLLWRSLRGTPVRGEEE